MGMKGLPVFPSREIDIFSIPSDVVYPIITEDGDYDVILNPSYEFERDVFGNITRVWIRGQSVLKNTNVQYYKDFIRNVFGDLISITGWKKP